MSNAEITLTALEMKGIKGILDSDYQDYGPFDRVWTFSANVFPDKSTFSGVVGSLVKKGCIESFEPDRNDPDGTLCLTEAGFNAYLANGGQVSAGVHEGAREYLARQADYKTKLEKEQA